MVAAANSRCPAVIVGVAQKAMMKPSMIGCHKPIEQGGAKFEVRVGLPAPGQVHLPETEQVKMIDHEGRR